MKADFLINQEEVPYWNQFLERLFLSCYIYSNGMCKQQLRKNTRERISYKSGHEIITTSKALTGKNNNPERIF